MYLLQNLLLEFRSRFPIIFIRELVVVYNVSYYYGKEFILDSPVKFCEVIIMSVCLSFYIEQINSHRTDFYKI